eukprot:7152863-Prymnesium_polylepis.1
MHHRAWPSFRPGPSRVGVVVPPPHLSQSGRRPPCRRLSRRDGAGVVVVSAKAVIRLRRKRPFVSAEAVDGVALDFGDGRVARVVKLLGDAVVVRAVLGATDELHKVLVVRDHDELE